MAMLDRGGVGIFYEVHGKGPVILLSHGYSATSEMWRGQIDVLSKTHRVVVWDMRGHGRSDYPADPAAYSEAETVADMLRILDAVGVEKAIVGGLSLGGYMSLAFNLAHPDRVGALLIIDTGPGFRNDAARDGWNANALKTAGRYEADGLGRLASGSPEMRMSRHRDATGLAKAARGMLTQRSADVLNSLPGIAVPTLVLVGADDAPFLNAADYMAAKIPGAVKVVISGAGHAANIDQPQVFNRAVEDFLNSADLDARPDETARVGVGLIA